MASRKEKPFEIIVYGNKAKVKTLTPGVDYMFHVETVRGEDHSTSVTETVTTSKGVS